MEHPLIGNLDNLSLDELQEKITELNKKLSIAHRMGNAYVCDQIRMAIDSYRSKYQEKVNGSRSNGKDPFEGKIDIS